MKFELGSEPAVFFDVSGTLLDAAPSRLMGVDLFPDARLLIPKLRARSLAGHKIVTGVVTNWGHRVHSLFEALAISDCFDLVLTAQDTGLLKPDERVFAEAAKRADRNSSNCVLVGDSLFHDALGAQRAGWSGLWVQRHEAQFESMAERALRFQLKQEPLSTLSELEDVLGEIWEQKLKRQKSQKL
jgi:putative hydrolase of the HAD superfamily